MEKQQRWQIKVQKNGVRKGFTSSTPGRRGKHEAEYNEDVIEQMNSAAEEEKAAAGDAPASAEANFGMMTPSTMTSITTPVAQMNAG